MTLHQALAFGLIGAAVLMFVWGRFRYDLVSLGILLLGVGLGVVPPKKAFDGFSNEIVVIIGSALVVSAAIARSGVIERTMQPFLRRFQSAQGLVPALAASTAGLSLATKNVGALAMLMPVALNAARRINVPPSRILMPMSFASLLGGVVTLVGTSPNIIVSEVRQETLGKPFAMFDFAPVGLCLTALGLVFLSFAYRLLPTDRRGLGALDEAMKAKTYTTEAEVPPSWPDGRTVADLKLSPHDVRLSGLVRNGERTAAPLPDAALNPGDVLLLEGEPQALDNALAASGLKLTRADKPAPKEEPSEEIRTAEAVIAPGSVLIGRSARRLSLYEQFGVNLLAVSRGGARLTERLRTLTLRAGDVLVLQAGERALPQVIKDLGLLPLAERDLQLGSAQPHYLPLLILLAAMGLVALQVTPVAIAFFGAAIAMVAVGGLPIREAYGAIDAPVLVLIAGLIPVSEAIRDSGGAALVAHALSGILGALPAIVALGVILVSAMVAAPFLSNVPTVLVLGPIAVALARGLRLNPDPFLMAVAVGAACDFLTPVGHQCNTLVMGPGGYRFSDYPRLGAPLSVLVVVAGTVLISIFWPLAPR